MLMPKKVKHRKHHRGSMAHKATGGTTINFGEYALQAMEPCWMTNNQIESARVAMTRHVKRGGQIWIRVFPDKPVTKKPAETRMGSGTGAPESWVAVVKPGRILFEMAGVPEPLAKEAMRLASHKLPIEVRFVTREMLGQAALTEPIRITRRMDYEETPVASGEGEAPGAGEAAGDSGDSSEEG